MKIQLLLFNFFLLSVTVCAQKPKVVILGVDHSTQLVNRNHQPSSIRSFIRSVNPSGICIERSPEEFSRNDFYEFTYEQQYVIIPYARENKLNLHPIDWIPAEKDIILGFGIDNLELPPFKRNANGFLGFTVFSDSASINRGLYFAEEEHYINEMKSWYSIYNEKVNHDFARRLFLYRTFLQYKRIESALKNYKESDTILVVIGAMHKYDIEKNLKENGYEVIRSDSYGLPEDPEIDHNFEMNDAYAILSFNLLGMQSHINKVNSELVNYSLNKLKNVHSAERRLFQTRWDLLSGKITFAQSIKIYIEILKNLDSKTPFTWTGVKHNNRVDSYFDPFGNLTVSQRLHLELCRAYGKTSNKKMFEKEKSFLLEDFKGYKKQMLSAYLETYLI